MTSITTRVLILLGWLTAATLPALHTRWTGIDDILRPDAVPLASDGRPQPVTLQYWGAERVLQLRAHYRAGLEGHQREGDGFKIKIPLQFDVVNPYWESIVETATEVDTSETELARHVFGRHGGEWTVMGPPNAIAASGGLPSDVLETSLYVYLVGQDSLNGAANQAIARYNKQTGVWDGLGTVNNLAWRIIRGPDGSIYVCGAFTDIAGTAVARVARWDGAAWSAVGATLNAGAVRDIIFDDQGNLFAAWEGDVYMTDDPTNAATVWTQVGAATGITDIYSLAFNPYSWPDLLVMYAGGSGGDRLAWCNVRATVPAWSAIAGVDNSVYILKMLPNMKLFIGGEFTERLMYYRMFPGLTPVSNPPDAAVYTIDYDPDSGTLFASGLFTSAGGLSLGLNAARYFPSGDYWLPMPFTLDPGAPNRRILRVRVGDFAPVILAEPQPPRNIWFTFGDGFGMAMTADLIYPATETIVTVNVPGGAASKPVIPLTAVGGYAIINSIVNRTTGDEVVLEVTIAPGETVVIDLVDLRVYSETFPDRVINPKPGSRFASWSLLPTGNTVDIRVNEDTGATLTGTLRYIQRYHSYRSADVP